MEHILKVIGRIEVFIANSTLAALFLAVLWGVMTRYITEKPAVWTTELSGILFTWTVFLGSTTAFREGQHIQINLLVECLPTIASKAVELISRLLVSVFLVFVAYLSYKMMMKGMTRLSPVLNIPFFWVYLSVFLSFSMMSLTSLVRLITPLRAGQTTVQNEVI